MRYHRRESLARTAGGRRAFNDDEYIQTPWRTGGVYLLATRGGLPMGFPAAWVIGVSILLLVISGVSGLLALGILKKSQPADLLR